MVTAVAVVNNNVVPNPTFQLPDEFVTVSGLSTAIAVGTAKASYAIVVSATVNTSAVPSPVFMVEKFLTPSALVNSSIVPSPVISYSYSVSGITTSVSFGTSNLVFTLPIGSTLNTSIIPTHSVFVEHFIEPSGYLNVSEIPSPVLEFYVVPVGQESLVALGEASFVIGGDYPSVENINEVPTPAFVYDVILNLGAIENINEVPGPIITTTVDEFIPVDSQLTETFLGDPELILSFNPLGVETIVEFGVPVFRQWSRASLIYTFLTSPKVIFRSRNHGNGF